MKIFVFLNIKRQPKRHDQSFEGPNINNEGPALIQFRPFLMTHRYVVCVTVYTNIYGNACSF